MTRQFKLRPEQIEPLAPGHGACIASDRITVEGQAIRWMYREAPDEPQDSGWRFFSGTEDDAYLADASRFAMYDVNTIANYDRSIIPWLGSPVGSAFERPDGQATFEAAPDWTAPEG